MTTSPPPHDDHPPPPPAWSDQMPLLIDLAVADLVAGAEVQPTMVAFHGEQPLFFATLRPFDRGGHQAPIIEVGALALGLDADRIMLSLSGRAWSLADPIPPVLADGGDLRQRVIVVHQADGTLDPPVSRSTIVPVDTVRVPTGGLDGGPVTEVHAGAPMHDHQGEGWVPQALLTLVAGDRRPAQGVDLGVQVRRCDQLGHRLAWTPAVLPLLEVARRQATAPDIAGEAPPPGWQDRTRRAA